VKSEFAARYAVRWLEPFGFENTYAVIVRGDERVRSVSELRGLGRNVEQATEN
jgi:glycine betaine/choline ABC-type transport system substrate-binding protein